MANVSRQIFVQKLKNVAILPFTVQPLGRVYPVTVWMLLSTSHVKVPIGGLYHTADVTHGIAGIVIWYKNNDINNCESHCRTQT